MSWYPNFSVPNRVQRFPKLQPNQFLQRSTHQLTWQASINFRLQHIIVCGTFPRLPTHINQQASECWHQAAFSSDAVTASSFFDATYAVFSQICQPHAVRVRFARCAEPFRFTARSNVICLACLSTLNQQCRQPKQQTRKLAYRLYTLACWIASQISAKAGLFHGQTLPSSTTGTRR